MAENTHIVGQYTSVRTVAELRAALDGLDPDMPLALDEDGQMWSPSMKVGLVRFHASTTEPEHVAFGVTIDE